MEHLRHPTDC